MMLIRLLRNPLSFIFTLTCLFLLVQPAQAQNACRDVFQREFALGALKPSFRHNDKYSNEINEKTAIKNQFALGTCHLHAWVSSIEKSYVKRTGQTMKVSMSYLSASHWIDRAMRTMMDKVDYEKGSSKLAVGLGATVISSRAAIRKFGVIPEEAWLPKTKFEQAPVAGRLEEFVVNRIGKAKWDLSREISEKRKHEIRERAEHDLVEIFEDIAGEIPDSFEYQGKTYTPQEFAREKFPEVFEPRINVFVNRSRKDPTVREKVAADLQIETSIDKTEELAKAAIDVGEPVYLSYEHNGNFVDKTKGIMSINAFNLPTSAGPMTRQQRAIFGTADGGHAVQLVGYDLDPVTKKVVKWKIQNSWGEKAGDRGFYHMYSDYFRAFVRGLSFSAAADVKLPANELKTEHQYDLKF